MRLTTTARPICCDLSVRKAWQNQGGFIARLQPVQPVQPKRPGAQPVGGADRPHRRSLPAAVPALRWSDAHHPAHPRQRLHPPNSGAHQGTNRAAAPHASARLDLNQRTGKHSQVASDDQNLGASLFIGAWISCPLNLWASKVRASASSALVSSKCCVSRGRPLLKLHNHRPLSAQCSLCAEWS